MDLFITANSVADGQDDAIPTTGTPQFLTNGDPTSINKPGSTAPAYWFNSLARNIRAIITGCGLTPDRTVPNQLWLALSVWFAPLKSPAFTGSPTAPTAGATDSSSNISTTAFVSGAVKTEATRAGNAEIGLGNQIAAEQQRAEGVEATLAPLVGPTFTGGLSGKYGPQNGYSLSLQSDGTAVFYAAKTAVFSVGSTGAIANAAFTAMGLIAAKGAIQADGNFGSLGSLSLGGPANANYQFNGDDKSGYNPVYSHTNGLYCVNGGIYGYSVTAAAAYLGTSNVGGPIVNFYGQAGVIGSITLSTATSVAYNTQSDRRAKTHIIKLDRAAAAARVMLLEPVSHRWRAAPDEAPIHGFLADQFQQVIPWGVVGAPGAVDVGGEPIMQQMDAAKAIPDLTAALQHALDRIAWLESRR